MSRRLNERPPERPHELPYEKEEETRKTIREWNERMEGTFLVYGRQTDFDE
jgi:hypothetical protein